jgi:hypothetical protein
MPSQHEPSDLDFTKPGKWRTMAIQQLHKSGHSVEKISKYSRLPLSRLCEILGAEAVVSDLFLHSRWTLKQIAKETGLPLTDVARLIGGQTRTDKHIEVAEDDDGLVRLRKAI